MLRSLGIGSLLLALGYKGDLDAGSMDTGESGSSDTGMLEGGSECDDGELTYAFEIDATESCYGVQQDWLPWATAEAVCAAWGGHLAALTTADEQAQVAAKMVAVAGALEAYETWIGASGTDGVWSWTSGEPFDFESWGPDQPNHDGPMACMTLNDSSGFQWHDEPCEDTYRLLCER